MKDFKLSAMLHPEHIRQFADDASQNLEDHFFDVLSYGLVMAFYPETREQAKEGRRIAKAALATVHFFHVAGFIPVGPREMMLSVIIGNIQYGYEQGLPVKAGHPCIWAKPLSVDILDRFQSIYRFHKHPHADWFLSRKVDLQGGSDRGF